MTQTTPTIKIEDQPVDRIVCPYCQLKVIFRPEPGKKCECGGVLPKKTEIKK